MDSENAEAQEERKGFTDKDYFLMSDRLANVMSMLNVLRQAGDNEQAKLSGEDISRALKVIIPMIDDVSENLAEGYMLNEMKTGGEA